MGTFAAGQVVVLPFPFSDLSRKKLRPGKLFTCHESLPINTVGLLNKAALQQARTAVVEMIQGG